MAVTDTASAEGRAHVELGLEGMTCASCAARIEKRLNELDGVEASVNLATERAAVAYDPARVAVPELIGAVEAVGYLAHEHTHGSRHEHDLPAGASRLAVSAALTLPLVVVAMISALHFGGWEWLALALATPIVFWGGLPFHRAALAAARHRAASMDTLISLGTLAAWTWSAVVLLAGADTDVYFEAAAVITTLILLGRWLEARAKRRSGDALRALLAHGAKEARVLRDGEEALVPVEALRPGDIFVVRPGEKIATDGVVEEGASAVDQSLLTGEPCRSRSQPAPRSPAPR